MCVYQWVLVVAGSSLVGLGIWYFQQGFISWQRLQKLQVAKLSEGFKRFDIKIDWILGTGVKPKVDEDFRMIAKFLPEVENIESGRANKSFLFATASFALASVMISLAALLQ